MIASSPGAFDALDAVLDDAIGNIYAATRDPALRQRVLNIVAHLFGAAGAVYVTSDSGEGAPSIGETAGSLPANYAASYAARGAALDPRPRFFEAHADSIYSSHDDRDPSDPHDALFFDGFLANCGIGESLGAQIAQVGSRRDFLFIERRCGLPPFAPLEIKRFRRLVHHLRLAARLAESVTSDQSLQQRLLDSLPLAAIIVDASRRLFFANAAARSLIAAGDGLSIVDGRLQPGRAFETNVLSSHLRSVALDQNPAAAAALLVARAGNRPLALLIAPLRAASSEENLANARMTVVLAELDRNSDALAAPLKQLFGLSKAEARVAVGVADGRRLHEIAVDHSISMPTVRTQLRAILRKMGVERQADIVRIARALPAGLASSPDTRTPSDAPPRIKYLSTAFNMSKEM